MTTQLKIAFEEASKLPADEQDALGGWILEELRSERKWDGLFARSQSILEELADEALSEFRAGQTKPLDPGS